MPENMPDRMQEDMSEYMPKDMTDRMPKLPEDMPDRMPNRMSEDMSDRMPEDLPVRKCINVMVGITRSKVISLKICLKKQTNYQAHLSPCDKFHVIWRPAVQSWFRAPILAI